ncbi:149aa long hypothetical protein [Pyrococcus horikoshii OT3]|uniref:Uncharacterized protein n=1 Tax=Pyrococcus horikoshii (strain ATCC 700860 / DSM 12428 / JCM 9974 / NBRC 100139 / OT-3) TaxID=70601 RepID=O58950_PYRHO|nr:149aa long hypothetical protein [Pyrococcus horikoshii OT3]
MEVVIQDYHTRYTSKMSSFSAFIFFSSIIPTLSPGIANSIFLCSLSILTIPATFFPFLTLYPTLTIPSRTSHIMTSLNPTLSILSTLTLPTGFPVTSFSSSPFLLKNLNILPPPKYQGTNYNHAIHYDVTYRIFNREKQDSPYYYWDQV